MRLSCSLVLSSALFLAGNGARAQGIPDDSGEGRPAAPSGALLGPGAPAVVVEALERIETPLLLSCGDARTLRGHPSRLRAGSVRWHAKAGALLREGKPVRAEVFGKNLRLLPERGSTIRGKLAYTGGIEGERHGWYTLIVEGDTSMAAGVFRAGDKEYHLRGDSLVEVDPRRVPGCGCGLPGKGPVPPGRPGDFPPLPGEPAVDIEPFRGRQPPKTVITVLVGFSPEAMGELTPAPGQTPRQRIDQEIELAVTLTNEALDRSLAHAELRLLETMEIAGYESLELRTSTEVLNDLKGGVGTLSTLVSRRLTIGADLLSFWVSNFEDAAEVAGRAVVLESLNRTNGQGVSVMMVQFAAEHLTFAHEVGHNVGCGHDLEAPTNKGIFEFSHGFLKKSIETDSPFRTVMAYWTEGDFGQLRIKNFSNPDLTFQKMEGAAIEPIGVPDQADNAQTINFTKGVVAEILPDRFVIANAGPDQVVPDLNLNGELVTLDASRSTPPLGGSITSFEWTNSVGAILPVPQGFPPNHPFRTVNLGIAKHLFKLKATGSNATVDTDEVFIFVTPFRCPIASAGEDQVHADSSSLQIIFDGSGTSDPDGRVQSFKWWKDGVGGTLLAESGFPMTPIVASALGPGDHEVTLQLQVNLTGLNDPDLQALCDDTDTVRIQILSAEDVQTVPFEHSTIQEAIDAAEDGELVLVSAGTYSGPGNRDITFRGKKITVRGEDGALHTIVDCLDTQSPEVLNWHRGFIFADEENNGSVLEGFTIRNGRIGNLNSSTDIIPPLRQQAENGDPVAAEKVAHFDGSIKELSGGGVLVVDQSHPILRNLILHQNQAQFDGGGIAVVTPFNQGWRRIERSRVHENESKFGNGGGIALVFKPDVSVSETTESVALLRNNLVFRNKAKSNLGGLVDGFGGGIAVQGVTTFVVNNTVAQNEASIGGGIAYFVRSAMFPGPGMSITNSIVYLNVPSANQIFRPSTTASRVTVTHCDVQGVLFPGRGNINVNPLFANITAVPPDYHLTLPPAGTTVSPIDSADGGVATRTDLERKPRFDEPTVPNKGVGQPEFVDMGCFELSPVKTFLRGDCNGDGQFHGQVTDAQFLLAFNFQGGAEPPCLAACDADGDGRVLGIVTDAIYILNFNFSSGPSPVLPFPTCGPGTLPSDLELGCETPLAGCN